MSTDPHWHTTIDSPIGPLGLVATDEGLRAVSWRGDETSVKLPDDMVKDPDHPILRQAAHQLNEYFDDFKRGSYDTRAIVFTGAGRAFCAGGDFSPKDPDALPDPWRRGHPEEEVVSFMRDCDAPIIGAINGYAMGGGFSLALACDLRIAADNAIFQAAQMKRGIVPEYGLSYFLQEQVGRQRALEIIFTARRLDAQEAHDLGLVLEVVPVDDLEARAVELATEIAGAAVTP